MAQSALRCSVLDLSTVARGSVAAALLVFFAASFADDAAAAAAAVTVVPEGDAFGLVGAGFSDSGTGDGVRS